MIMSTHGLNNLRFADYSVSLGSVPSKFDIPSDILILSNSVIPSHDFKLEKEVLYEYCIINMFLCIIFYFI